MDHRLLPDIMVFLEVARAGSLTQAAKRLNTVQSNVTARIKKLEEALGVSLLQRHARGVKITHGGEAVLAMAQRVDVVLDDLRFAFGKHAKRDIPKVRIGGIETVVAIHLPDVVAGFVRRHPNVDIAVQAGSTAGLITQLKAGDLDAAFISRPAKMKGFRDQVVFEDELIVVAPTTIRTMSELLAVHTPELKVLVQRLGCSYTERLLTVLAGKVQRSYRVSEVGTLEGVLGFVRAGVGIAAMPRSFVELRGAQDAVSLISLPRNIGIIKTHLVAPNRENASAVINEFVEYCRSAPLSGRPRSEHRDGVGAF